MHKYVYRVHLHLKYDTGYNLKSCEFKGILLTYC